MSLLTIVAAVLLGAGLVCLAAIAVRRFIAHRRAWRYIKGALAPRGERKENRSRESDSFEPG